MLCLQTQPKAENVEAVTFFARFLEEQVTQGADPPSYPIPFTYKYPSDQEDVQ